MTLEEVKQTVRNIPDFPIPGIQFKDLTTAFLHPEALKTMKEVMMDEFFVLSFLVNT